MKNANQPVSNKPVDPSEQGFSITSRGFGFLETGEAFDMATGRLVATVQCMNPDSRNETERAACAAWRAWLVEVPAGRSRRAA